MWYGGKLMTEDEVRATSSQLPSRYQMGEEVCVCLIDTKQSMVSVPARVVGVNFSPSHGVLYDLAFKIEGTALYSVQRRIDAMLKTCGDKQDGCSGCKNCCKEVEECLAFDCDRSENKVVPIRQH